MSNCVHVQQNQDATLKLKKKVESIRIYRKKKN
jgi:hypothetical protein